MRYISIRQLRNSPGRVWSTLSKGDLVLTANGKPRGVLVGVDETHLEETVEAIQRAKAIVAVSRMQKRAAESGTARLSMAEIDREIRLARKGPKSRRRT